MTALKQCSAYPKKFFIYKNSKPTLPPICKFLIAS